MPAPSRPIRSARHVAAAVGACVGAFALATSLLGIAPSTAAPAAQPRLADSSTLLPAWARTGTVTGEREVWLLPAYDAGESTWDREALLDDINAELDWFAEMSRGRFSLTATRVLPPLHFDSDRGSSCDAAARVLAPAISRFYADAPVDTHLVALTRSSDCPYSAIGDTPGRSLILTGFSPSSEASARTLLHELGHNLGLPHSSGYPGALLSSAPSPTRLGTEPREYAALTDVMGSIGAAPRLSAASLAALGWGEGVTWVPSDVPGTHAVAMPEVSAPGPDAVVVDDPVSGLRYSFTYIYAPRETAPGLPLSGRGVYLHQVHPSGESPSDYGRSSFSYWMPWEGHHSGSSLGLGAGPGTAWVSPTGGVAMRVVSMDRGTARLEVRVDPRGQLTDRTGPAWPLEPSLEVRAGTLATLHLPAAWDQSGVTRYRITAQGAEVLSVRTPGDLVFAGGATLALSRPRALVRVIATDGEGNSTTWQQRVSARG